MLAVPARHLGRKYRTDGAVDVAHRHMNFDGLLLFECVPAKLDELAVERLVESVILFLDAVQRPVGRHVRFSEDRAQVDAACLPMLDRLVGVEAFDVTDHLGELAKAQHRHVFAEFARNEHHEVDDVLGLALEFLAQFGILRREATSAALAKPNSSAPSNAAIATSRPVLSWPSVSTLIRPRRLFITRICCVSASPSSHGMPACLIDVSGEAPVPPS